jgi:BirA family biotin operon repressor/biotin-[acetyl-CoA-carboxylase] ligase
MTDFLNGEFLSPDSIRSGLLTRFVGQTVYYWPAIGSTNDELKRLADEGAPEGALAIADEQTAGRGRLRGRTWVAPAGSSLLMSLLFRPDWLAPARAQQITMLCALAAADAVVEIARARPGLKWPNDLLLDGKKLAGVLTELSFSADKLAWAVVGVGLNVNAGFAGQPELADTAVSLSMAIGRPVARLRLLHAYLAGVEARYQALRAGQSPHREWAARLATLGQAATVHAPDGVYRGIAEGVDEAGALLLRQASGEAVRILAGDVRS